MSLPAQIMLVTVGIVVVWLMFMHAMLTHTPRGMMPERNRATRWHYNDPKQIAKLRHPSASPKVYECWDPQCDCHLGKSLPYDWKYDSDLTSDTPTH
jgi:hypothetical protein